jgi:hypothetical protein
MSFISGASLAGSRAAVTTAAQPNITSLGTLTALTVDDVAIDGKVVTMTGSSSDTAVFTVATNGAFSLVTTDDAAAAANITITADGTAELAGTTVTLNSGGDIDLNADGGDVFLKDASTTYGSLTNTSGNLIIKSGTTTALTFSGANVTLAGTVGSGAITSTGVVTATGFTIGSAAIVESELEMLDGITAGTVAASKAVVVDSNKDAASFRNITLTGELDAGSLDVSGNADIDGTLEADAYTVDGTALDEYIADTVGAMVGSNTETGIAVTYQDGDNTLDFVIGTLNQDTSGTAAIATTVTITDNESTDEDNAIIFTAGGDVDGGNIGLESDGTLTYNPSTGKVTATGFVGTLTGDVTGNADTVTALASARTIGGTSFDGTANIAVALAATATTLATARTIGGTSFDGSANIAVALAATATALASARTIGGVSFDGTANINLPGVNTSGSQDTSGTAAKVTVTDSTANTNFPVTFHDESNALLDDTGALRYNPSTGTLLVPNLTVAGTTTQVDTVTMNAENAVVFEGATADNYETTLSIVDPTADRTQYLINQTGYIPLLAASTTTAITSTPAELNLIDGGTSRGTTAVASGDGILINDGGTMLMTNVDTVSTYFASHSVGGGNIVTVGALDSGSITSGFTSIDVGAGAITTTGVITGGTVEATTDTAAGDNAAIGYTSAEGLILTGQGSTSDITIKNDADTAVISIPTGTTNVTIAGDLTISGDDLTMGTNTSGAALIADGTNFNPVVISGDISINTSGVAAIGSGVIVVGDMAANSIDSAQYVDGSIDAAHYAAGSVDATALGADAVTAAKIGDNVLNSEHYAAASIDNEHLADDAVDSAELAAGAVDLAHMSVNSVDSDQYVDGSIDLIHMSANSVDSDQYVDGSIDTAHIADDAVTLAKMASGTDGNIISFDASGNPVAIATGSDGQVLTSTGAGSPPAFEAAGGAGYFVGGASGVSGDSTNGLEDIFRCYSVTVDNNCTIPSASNASAIGPLTISDGATVTVDGFLFILN